MATVYRVHVMRANGPAAYTVWETVCNGVFTDLGEADEYARENVDAHPGYRAEISDDGHILYSVPSDAWIEESPLAAHASHYDRGRPVYTTD